MNNQIYFVLLTSAILPLIIFALINIFQFKNIVFEMEEDRLESILNEWLVENNREFKRIFTKLDLIVSNECPGILEEFNKKNTELLSSENKVFEYLFKDESIVNKFVFFDDSFAPIYEMDSTGVRKIMSFYPEVRLSLQNTVFSKKRVTIEISLPDQTSALYIYYRVYKNNDLSGYVICELNYDWLNINIAEDTKFKRNIFNERYQLVASNGESLPWSVHLNAYTERMVDGFSETVEFEGKIHSYSFIDLGETALYADIYTDLKNIDQAYKKVHSLSVFFVLFTLLMSVVYAWSFSKRITSYGESILINQRYTSEMRFFSRMEDNINSLTDDLQTLSTMQTRFDYLKNDLNVILKNIPEGVAGDDGKTKKE